MKKLFTLFFIMCLRTALYAGTVTIGGNNETGSRAIPVATSSQNNTASTSFVYASFSQQIYLASELNAEEAGAKDITAITFYLTSGSGTAVNRGLQVWIMETSKDSFDIELISSLYKPKMIYNTVSSKKRVGTKVFAGQVDIGSSSSYTISFNQNGNKFSWNGTSNIVVTVIDTTNADISRKDVRHTLTKVGHTRFLHRWTTSETTSGDDFYWINDADFWFVYYGDQWPVSSANTAQKQVNGHIYVPKVTFTYGNDAQVAPSTPDDLAVSATTTTSATLSWSSVTGADSYDLQQSANGSDWSTLSTGETGTSYSWTGLTAASTQYVRICAVNEEGSSGWSDAVTVTTDAVYTYDDITFTKWTSTNSLPTSGNYYLNADVALGSGGSDVTISGDLNLCLNGHVANLAYQKIIIPDETKLTIYNNSSDEGKITSIVPGQIESFEVNFKAVIIVKNGGTLILKEGTIENNFVHDPSDPSDVYSSYGIYSNGTVKLSGDALINSNDADICLHSTNVITIAGVLSNSEKHSVYRMPGDFTSGWDDNMNGKRPDNYFSSANSSYRGVGLNGSSNEARILSALSLSDSDGENTATVLGNAVNVNVPVNIALTRSFSSSYCNTICLPFSLTDAQLQEIFGTDYELWDFTGSSLDGEDIALGFIKVKVLEAGKPYLIKPSVDVVNPTFEGVTIAATEPADPISDAYIDFKGIYAPKLLTAGNHNILFLGANNRLFFASEDGYMNGFRAYFEVKGSARLAVRAHIVQRDNATTGIESPSLKANSQKRIKNGQLLIEHNGVLYNAQAQIVQ